MIVFYNMAKVGQDVNHGIRVVSIIMHYVYTIFNAVYTKGIIYPDNHIIQ